MRRQTLVVLVLLTLYLSPSSKAVIDWIAIAAAAGGALSAGASVAQAASADTSFNVRMKMQVENYSRWSFVSVATYNKAGHVGVAPADLLSGRKEVLYTHKVGNTAKGTWGTIEFETPATDLVQNKIYIMWSVPYSHDLHSNWLGIYCTSAKFAGRNNLNDLTNDMYNSNDFRNNRKEYYTGVNQLSADCGEKYKVIGVMGTSHAPEVNVKIVPKLYDDFAATVKAYVERQNTTQNARM